MTTISAKIILDSRCIQTGARITTMMLRYPRFIHAEELTHRVIQTLPNTVEVVIPDGVMYDRDLSRNASSSRAIPIKRLIEDIRRDPAMPIHWGKNQPGMQAHEECEEKVHLPLQLGKHHVYMTREGAWLRAMDWAIAIAEGFDTAGYHKQIANRLLEPFAHINVVVTATEWSNFFALRRHPDAEPHINMLANEMYNAIYFSEPQPLLAGEWHLPFTDRAKDDAGYFMPAPCDLVPPAAMLSAARCARTSYLTHEGKEPEASADFDLFDKLMGGDVKHASPTEHQAVALDDGDVYCRNLKGFNPFRAFIPGDTL